MYSFVATAEKLVSDYRFGVYDILFLPDSFPYGGEPARTSQRLGSS
jgi:hypothetical protein